MATLIVPPLDDEPWPTLGPAVCDFIEAHCVHGPGEIAGQPYRFTPERRAQWYRAYEVYPRGHQQEGRRRFKTVAIEERKGKAKTESAMVVALTEAHPEAEVRFDGWRKVGRSTWEPVGRPMQSPYIPLVSYTVEQTEDLGYNVLRYIIDQGPPELAKWFDTGMDRIVVLDALGRAAGKIVPLAGSPNARDGALTTFQHFDEPHRMFSPRLRKAWATMNENIYKRPGADAWTLSTSTAGDPSEESIQRDLFNLATKVDRGEEKAPRLFYFRRHAPLSTPLDTPEQVHAALIEATGPGDDWSADLLGLVDHYFRSDTDKAYWRRVWLNQWLSGSGAAFDIVAWTKPVTEEGGCLDVSHLVPDGALITLGFDGSLSRDATALIATEVETGYQWPLGIWERPANLPDDVEWAVPEDEIDALLEASIAKRKGRYQLWRLYGDPHRWREPLRRWAGLYGAKVILDYDTTKWKRMAYAVRGYADAIAEGTVRNGGDATFSTHIGNCRRRELQGITDEATGEPLWVLTKDRPREFIDGGVAGVLSWEARTDAIQAGATAKRKSRAVGF